MRHSFFGRTVGSTTANLSAGFIPSSVLAIAVALLPAISRAAVWDGYAGDPQHTADSSVASQSLQGIHWTTPVDLNPQFHNYGGEEVLLIHYGSPAITAANTVIVPVKTGTSGTFELNAYNGATGAFTWSQPTDYQLPPQGFGSANFGWTPSYGPVLAQGSTLYYPGNGGTVYSRGSLNTNGSVTPSKEPFYAFLFATYQANAAAYNASVAISTPITADANGNIYFGYTTSASAPGGLTSGIAQISSTGGGTFLEASQLMAGTVSAGMTQVVTNCAPALSPDGSTVYVTMSAGEDNDARIVAMNSTTLAQKSSQLLMDPQTNSPAYAENDGTASPMVGPDGDVYVGAMDNYGTSRGFMEHFSGDLLSPAKNVGGFGWDDTASVIPASMVPSYTGTSKYLIMTKYNNYAGPADGKNEVAILDPNATQTDTRTNYVGTPDVSIMKEVEVLLGPTADQDARNDGYINAVDEWCINTAAVDPATDSVLVTSEDGKLYRWNLGSNSITQTIEIDNGLGQAYTPTEIGPDGTVYAINNATLFAVGSVPEPTTTLILAITFALTAHRPRRHI